MPNEDSLIVVLHEMQHALVGMQQLLGVQSNIILQLLKETPEKSEFAKSLAFNQSFAKASMENLKEWNRSRVKNENLEWEAHSYRVAMPYVEDVIKALESLNKHENDWDDTVLMDYRHVTAYAVKQLRTAIGTQETN